MPPELLVDLFAVLEFVAVKHQYKRRKGFPPLPYINHLIKVAGTLVREAGVTDREVLTAALLHDVVEDTSVTVEEIRRRFGDRAADLVEELTDKPREGESYADKLERQAREAPSFSYEARLIKLADKGCNTLDIFHYPLDWPAERKYLYLRTARQLAAAVRGTHPALEDWFEQLSVRAEREHGSTGSV